MRSSGHTLTRREMLTALAATPAVAFLAGCGGDNGASGGDGLRLSHWWRGQFDEFIPLMEEKTGIKVESQNVAGQGYPQKLLTELASATGPDIFLLDAPVNGEFFSSGVTIPFNDYLASRKDVDMSKWDVDPKRETGYRNEIMALSVFTMQDPIVHVNQELAEKDGLLDGAPLWGKPNFDTWKWDQLVEWAKAGTKISSTGKVEQYGLGGDLSFLIAGIVHDNGGQVFDSEWDYNETKCLLDQEPALEAIQLLTDLIVKHKVCPAPAAETAIRGGSYVAKRAVGTINWSTPSIFPEQDTFPQTQFHLPYVQHKVHAVGANHLCVNKASSRTDEALEWVTTFCTDKEMRTKFLQVSSVPSYDPLPIVEAAPDNRAKTIALINLSRLKGMSTIPKNTEGVRLWARWLGGKDPAFIGDTINTAYQQVVIGKSSVADAFTEATAKINEKLAESE